MSKKTSEKENPSEKKAMTPQIGAAGDELDTGDEPDQDAERQNLDAKDIVADPEGALKYGKTKAA